MRSTKLKNQKFLTVKEIKKNIQLKELNSIINLIKKENYKSILSHLSKKIITRYLETTVKYNNAHIFVLLKKNLILGYALYFKRETDIFQKFSYLKFKIIKELIFGLKIIVLLNIFLAVTRFDLILFKSKKKKDENYINLNLLAINRKYQSKGYGNFLIKNSAKKLRSKNIKVKKIICEAPSKRVLNFYLKNNFKIIGKKLRLFHNFYILQKRI